MGIEVSDKTTELITNGTFDTDSDWTKQYFGWTISGGKARHAGVYGTMLQYLQADETHFNLLRIDVDSFDDLALNIGFAGVAQLSIIAAGSYAKVILPVADMGTPWISLEKLRGDCVIDNVSMIDIADYILANYSFLADENIMYEIWPLDNDEIMIRYASFNPSTTLYFIININDII